LIASGVDNPGPTDFGEGLSTEPQDAPSPPLPQQGVLVVDDEASLLALLDIGLRHHGFTVWLAAEGQEAIELYRRHEREIGVVLLDVVMPRLDGVQTFQALQKINPQLRCCFMTGQAGSISDARLLELGAAGVLKKPFSLADVAEIIRQLAGYSLEPLPSGQSVERRVWPRRRREVEVLLADIGGREAPFAGLVVNYSLGGLCLTTDREIREGMVLRARTPAATGGVPWVQIKVRNRRRKDGSWELGCEFVLTPAWEMFTLLG